MGEVEFGTCKVCKQDKPLLRKYYHYNINCNCCGSEHFEYVAHCKDCTPVEPSVTRVYMKTDLLKKFSTERIPMAIRTLSEALASDEAYRETWIASISMAFIDTVKSTNPESNLDIETMTIYANRAAVTFLKNLINNG